MGDDVVHGARREEPLMPAAPEAPRIPVTLTDAHERLHREAAALLRDLEAAAHAGALSNLHLASALMEAVHRHIDPLRKAISDVEFHQEVGRVFDFLDERHGLRVAAGSLDGLVK